MLSRRDLLGLGFSRAAIEHRIEYGRLHPVAQGIYAVGWPGMNRERRWMAAILSCGWAAALSHRSAGALWGICDEVEGRIDISVRRRCEHRRPGIRARSRPTLPERDVVAHGGFPVTGAVCTLVDLAAELGRRRL